MNRRFRVLAALLALVALSAYLAEGVVTSWCMPDMATGGSEVAELADGGPHAGMHHAPAESPDDTDGSRSEAPRCPLGMTGPGSSCVAASLPAATHAVSSAPTIHEAALFLIEHSPDRMLVSVHFRPPRA